MISVTNRFDTNICLQFTLQLCVNQSVDSLLLTEKSANLTLSSGFLYAFLTWDNDWRNKKSTRIQYQNAHSKSVYNCHLPSGETRKPHLRIFAEGRVSHPAIKDSIRIHRYRVCDRPKGSSTPIGNPCAKTCHQCISVGFQQVFTGWSSIFPQECQSKFIKSDSLSRFEELIQCK